MTEQDFASGMLRLKDRWKSTYSTELERLIAREVKTFPGDWWQSTVDKLIGEHRQPPLLPEIREHISRARERAHFAQGEARSEISWSTTWSCEYCFDHGVYLCREPKGQHGYWAFRCHCAKGLSDPRAHIPQFKPSHAERFQWIDGRKLREGVAV